MGMDPYEKLGVSRDADDEEIRRAYRHRAKQDHPDTVHGESDAFRRLNDAYETIRTPERRRQYAGYSHRHTRTDRNDAERDERRTYARGDASAWSAFGHAEFAAGRHTPRTHYRLFEWLETLFAPGPGSGPATVRRYRSEVRIPRRFSGTPFSLEVEFPDQTRRIELPVDVADGELLTYHETDRRGRTVVLDLRVWLER